MIYTSVSFLLSLRAQVTALASWKLLLNMMVIMQSPMDQPPNTSWFKEENEFLCHMFQTFLLCCSRWTETGPNDKGLKLWAVSINLVDLRCLIT
jgi:hypothetical protein